MNKSCLGCKNTLEQERNKVWRWQARVCGGGAEQCICGLSWAAEASPAFLRPQLMRCHNKSIPVMFHLPINTSY